MRRRAVVVGLALALSLGVGSASAQDVEAGAQTGSAEELPGATRVVLTPEGTSGGTGQAGR